MTNETTMDKLREMRLTALAEAFRSQLTDSSFSALSFEERLGLLVDIEWSSRKSHRLQRLLRSANLDQNHACIADIDYNPGRRLNRAEILRLANCTYIDEAHNIIILGATGTGKSYLACAFGVAACQKFKSVKYVRLPDLLVELAIARNEGIYKKVMNQYSKMQLLILDCFC